MIYAVMNKGVKTSPLYRTSGSIDIVASVRSILAVVRRKDAEDPSERLLVHLKSNLAPQGPSILFRVSEHGTEFICLEEISADEAFAAYAPRMGRPRSKRDIAVGFLEEMLSDGQWHLASECIDKLTNAGCKESTWKSAKRELGVETAKPHERHLWRLQPAEAKHEDVQMEMPAGNISTS